jgi:hypothetical protein
MAFSATQKEAETINFASTSDTAFAAMELRDNRFITLAVDTFTKDSGGNCTITAEYSFDKINWYKVKLPSNSATNWSKVYSADASAEFIYVIDSTVLIPIPAPYARFSAQLASFAGSPVLTVRQGTLPR